MQQLEKHIGAKDIWESYGGYMKDILNAYRSGINEYIHVDDNGLVSAWHPTLAMTWMDAVVDGHPVTGREGYQVEINALWYNAICYTLARARKFRDKAFVESWTGMPERIKESFIRLFWSDEEGYLADYVDMQGKANRFIRPNQIVACSLDYRMVTPEQCLAVFRTVRQHLLTPVGLRTLSPRNPLYEGHIEGDQCTRDLAYHQGTVWVWLLEHYAKVGFDLKGADFVPAAEEMIAAFEEGLTSSGIGSVNEIYDGDPPHTPRGAISQAWSVGAVLRIMEMIAAFKTPAGAGKGKSAGQSAAAKKSPAAKAEKEAKQVSKPAAKASEIASKPAKSAAGASAPKKGAAARKQTKKS